MAVFLLLVVRGPLNAALDYEESNLEGTAHTHDSLFSTGMQELGGSVGLILFGTFLGIIFAVVMAALSHRFGDVTPLQLSLRMGLVGFVVVVLVPFLKYPANPPAVGDPATVNERTLLYFAILAFSIMLAYGVALAVASSSFDALGRSWLATGLYGTGLIALFALMPGAVDPVDAPTDLVWDFRLASLGGLAVVWTMLSLFMGTYLTLDQREQEVPLDLRDDRSRSLSRQ